MFKKHITFIKHRGSPGEATLFDGSKVYRQKDIYVPSLKRNVETAPYDNHFVYVVPKHIPGWGLLCTCGGPAVYVGALAYEQHGSPTSGGDGKYPGELVVCMTHTESGKHADGNR